MGMEEICKECLCMSCKDIECKEEACGNCWGEATTFCNALQDQVMHEKESAIIPFKEFKTKPYEHQDQAFNRFWNKDFFALFAEQGTGKTKITIDIACEAYRQGLIEAVIVVAPNGVHEQWCREQIPIHSSLNSDNFIWDAKRVGRKYYDIQKKNFVDKQKENCLKWFYVNVETFSSYSWENYFPKFVTRYKCFMVIDESTRIKNPNAKRTKAILSLSMHQNIVKKAILTGTPVSNSPFDIWAMFDFLKHNFFDCNFFIFQHRYGVLVKDINPATGRKYNRLLTEVDIEKIQFYLRKNKDMEAIAALTGISEKNIRFIIEGKTMGAYKRLDELKELINPHSFFIKKEDCLDLPPKIYKMRSLKMSREQKQVYEDLKRKLLAVYEGKELSILNKVALIIRLMQVTGGFFPYNAIAEDMDETEDIDTMATVLKYKPEPIMIGKNNPKLIALKEDLEEFGDERIIIWAQFIAEIKAIVQTIKKAKPEWTVEEYHGKINQHQRKDILAAFKNNEVKILVANKAASTGLNLQNSSVQIFYSNNYSLETRLQSEDRSHRIGQEKPVLYIDYVMEDTVDEKVAKTLVNKKNILDYFRNNGIKEII